MTDIQDTKQLWNDMTCNAHFIYIYIVDYKYLRHTQTISIHKFIIWKGEALNKIVRSITYINFEGLKSQPL